MLANSNLDDKDEEEIDDDEGAAVYEKKKADSLKLSPSRETSAVRRSLQKVMKNEEEIDDDEEGAGVFEELSPRRLSPIRIFPTKTTWLSPWQNPLCQQARSHRSVFLAPEVKS